MADFGITEAIAIASLVAAAAGTAVSAVGQSQQAKAAAAASSYQAQVARNNQILAERAALDAQDRGRIAEQRQRIATRALQGRQRAVLAGNNVDVNLGSAVNLQADTAGLGELDALTIRSNAEREALGFRQQGMNFGAQSDLLSSQASSQRAAGSAGMFGTILTGAGSVASKWYGFQSEGVFSSKVPTVTPGNSYLPGPI